ncbi:ADP-ribosylation factor-binding protein GGA1 isoform X2 [Eurosta solidaginis]|uniref:ADP-ribosylation factor-binding protein GGA1 isoform X2 n=1 Tax=Eurosta solidaginis TaxID=178769 RepID=UPI0035311B1B
MTTNETIMEEMLNRATNPSRETVDELSLQMFCLVVKSNPKLIDRAQEMIMLKLLEECMTQCGTEFQDEAAKFRFLNQLIRLVSKKYQGADTPMPVKKRIMECLLLWTTELPQKTKIREVYDMLCRDDGVVHGTTPAIEAKRESTLGIDEEMLSKLIKSKNPEDYKRANLLIQNRVKQDARRMELGLECKNTLQEVQTTVNVLEDMLKIYELEGKQHDRESETMMLLHEVYQACKKHKTFMERLPTLIENFDEALTVEAMSTKDSLQSVLRRYKTLVGTPKLVRYSNSILNTNTISQRVPTKSSNAELLTDLLGDSTNTSTEPLITPATTTTDFATPAVIDELELLGATGSLVAGKLEATATKQSFDDLHSIFNAASSATSSTNKTGNIFSSLDILQPVNVFSNSTTIVSSAEYQKQKCATSDKSTFRQLPDIDKLSEDLLQKSLQDLERVYSFKKEAEKHTLNDLAQEKNKQQANSSPPTTTLSAKVSESQLDQLNESEEQFENKEDDDLMLPTKDEDNKIPSHTLVSERSNGIVEAENITPNQPPIKHLADIDIDLDEIVPAAVDPLTLNGDDITLTLNYTDNRIAGCKQTSIIVISANNKSKSFVNNFKFDASVRKPCKVRVLKPTATEMSPCKPFRPATPINQIMLLLNPTGKPIDVTCIIEYELDEDPDPIKESIIAKNIPYVN